MTDIVGFLQSSEWFKDVPRPQIEWLVRESQIITYPIGPIFSPGDVFHEMIVILEGGFQAHSIQNGQKKIMMTATPGMVTGLLPFSRMKGSPVYIEATAPVVALSLDKSRFHEMIRENFELVEMMVHSMTDRVRHFTSTHFQDEKLMALGKLSAGVAHELNNPAAAIIRSAEDLKRTLAPMLTDIGAMAALQLTPRELETLTPFLLQTGSESNSRLSLIERKQQEDELLDWLDDHSVPIDDAQVFLEFGYRCDDLESIRKIVGDEKLEPIVTWLARSLEAQKGIQEIGIASRRISELVQSVKNYTRMDQVQDMQDVCINDGIRNTLTMLQHKMKRNGVALHEELAFGLPQISGFPGELNQVWTNIIDNALDAMKSGGELTVRTLADHDRVSFSATDTGTGIPKENLDRIFDPFFTTKDVGEGTGVGLDLVMKIVNVHHGNIEVTSKPGHTEFRISFPVSTN